MLQSWVWGVFFPFMFWWYWSVPWCAYYKLYLGVLLVPRHNISHYKVGSVRITPPCALDTTQWLFWFFIYALVSSAPGSRLHVIQSNATWGSGGEEILVPWAVSKKLWHIPQQQTGLPFSCVYPFHQPPFRSRNALPPNGGAIPAGPRRAGMHEPHLLVMEMLLMVMRLCWHLRTCRSRSLVCKRSWPQLNRRQT